MHEDSATEEIPAVGGTEGTPGTPEWDAAYFTLVPPREAPRAHARRRRRVGVLPVALLGCVAAAAVLGWALLTPDTSSTAARQGASVPVAPVDSPAASVTSAPAATPSPSASASPARTSAAPSASTPARTRTAPTSSAPRTSAPAASSPAATAAATLRAGDSGPDVAHLQQLLFQQGFTYVRITGVYDKATVRGVRQFQRDRSLTADPYGVYGPATRAALEG